MTAVSAFVAGRGLPQHSPVGWMACVVLAVVVIALIVFWWRDRKPLKGNRHPVNHRTPSP